MSLNFFFHVVLEITGHMVLEILINCEGSIFEWYIFLNEFCIYSPSISVRPKVYFRPKPKPINRQSPQSSAEAEAEVEGL